MIVFVCLCVCVFVGSFEEAAQAMEFAQAKIHSLSTLAREVCVEDDSFVD